MAGASTLWAPGVAKRGGQRVAEPRRVLRILKNKRRLQINVGVQARRQAEVAPHERAGLFIQFEGLPARSVSP